LAGSYNSHLAGDGADYRVEFHIRTADGGWKMNAGALERLMLENALRQALAGNQFFLHHQPQLDLADGRVIGIEALMRWQHPEMGLISPAKLIPICPRRRQGGPHYFEQRSTDHQRIHCRYL
jgi:hypothetical protein